MPVRAARMSPITPLAMMATYATVMKLATQWKDASQARLSIVATATYVPLTLVIQSQVV